MATASLFEAISFLREPPKSRPAPLQWKPLFHKFRSQSPFRNPNFVRIRTLSLVDPAAIIGSSTTSTSEEGSPFGGALKNPVAAAVLLGLAASGGRMGGRTFCSSPPTRSYSVRSDSSFSYSAPYYAPSPFGAGGGFYVGPVLGVGLGAGSGFFLLMMSFAAVILLSGFLSDRPENGSVLTATQKTSVLKLQVGLLGMARSLQNDLDQIAETSDTSTSSGLLSVLTESALALLRHPGFCISAYSSVDVRRSIEDGEKRFNQLSIEERGKFDEETFVNINTIKKRKTSSQRSKGFNNEYIVITILVAVEGVHKLPIINGSADLKEALQTLGSIRSNKTLAVEVLWTPQNENDTLTERELLEDYPLLRPL